MSALRAATWLDRDVRICHVANRWGSRQWVLTSFGIVSRLGDGVFWYALMLALACSGNDDGPATALHMALVGGVACLFYRSLKRWTRRPRPFRRHGDIVAHVAPLDEYSFPSGHTLHAVSFTIVAVAWFPFLGIVLVPFALLVAASRVILGLHYPSDVLAAVVIGSVLGGASLWLAGIVETASR